ncbi:MAG: hypothetical protein IJS08_17070 [Victivallales bacterium]|nr:hypothetical protein [Victivallales bacterium]
MLPSILPFEPNRVLRLYLGGSGIDKICGKETAVDNRYPENWIASCIEGNGRAYHSPGHGISKIRLGDEIVSFPEYLAAYAEELLGERHLRKYDANPAVLVKLLDSAEQLPMQVHPTKEDARRHLGSSYGKTEAWLVLATRKVNGEDPYLLVGFNERLDKEIFMRECLEGQFTSGLSMLNRIDVKPGDTIIIRGGVPHAIGPGVTMVEVMEPSDWVVIPEINCCGVQLSEKQRFMGIAPETAIGMFEFTPQTQEQIRARFSPVPKILRQTENGTLRSLISPADCELFSASELVLDGTWLLENQDACAIGIITEGALCLDDIPMRAGENFFLPYATRTLQITGRGKMIMIRPPKA